MNNHNLINYHDIKINVLKFYFILVKFHVFMVETGFWHTNLDKVSRVESIMPPVKCSIELYKREKVIQEMKNYKLLNRLYHGKELNINEQN